MKVIPGRILFRRTAPIEGDPNGSGDRHILIVDRDACVLYELYAAHQVGGQWDAGSGAIFDLNSNALRPDTWTSADAAGLPILPGLARYDEVASGEINHAMRFTSADAGAPTSGRRDMKPHLNRRAVSTHGPAFSLEGRVSIIDQLVSRPMRR